MILKCKILAPKSNGKTYDIEAEDADHAAMDCWFDNHYDSEDNLVIRRWLGEDLADMLHFALIDVEGEEIITRYVQTGIWRCSGVKPLKWEYDKKLRQIADALRWERDPSELLEEWPYEERP